MFKASLAGIFAFANAAQVEQFLDAMRASIPPNRGFGTYLPVSANVAYCLKQNGMNSAVIQAYSNGNTDTEYCDTFNAVMG
jgi:hypothetical protein